MTTPNVTTPRPPRQWPEAACLIAGSAAWLLYHDTLAAVFFGGFLVIYAARRTR